jgi:flagellar biosynthesis protein FliP
MTAAGYAGMLATLAFVLGLVLLVARLAKRFLPAAIQGGGSDSFSVVQRIALGQRQGIAIVKRGDMLIGVSVGDGGVRTLFTMAADAASAPAMPSDKADDAPVMSFPRLLGDAIRGRSVRAMLQLVLLGALAAPSLFAQRTGAPARAATPVAAANAQASSKPSPIAPSTGGGTTIAPLMPAPQARDIAALHKRAEGNAPLTTPEAQRIAGRADSMLAKLAPQMELKVGGAGQNEGLRMSGTVGVVIMMGLLSLLPMLLLMMTGFTRILVVLHFLKQALGTQSAPPGQLLAAMALLLSGFVMGPTLKEVNANALEPWMDGKIEQVEMMTRALVPFKAFMLRQVRDQDLQTFVDLADIKQPESREAVPLTVLMSAFVTSELRTAFQIGFALFLPFIVIDVVVGSVLMSMGMVMLPPAMISLPFKLLLFVLVDGWGLVVTGLVQSFR